MNDGNDEGKQEEKTGTAAPESPVMSMRINTAGSSRAKSPVKGSPTGSDKYGL
jgi:hypothetical protein